MENLENENEYENEYENENENETRHAPYTTGFLSGLFLIFGLYAGVLYTGEERHKFISGWKIGFFTVIFLSIIIIFLDKFA